MIILDLLGGIPPLNSWDPVYSLVGIGGLGWWLSGRFRKTEERLDKKLDDHEDQDARRHEENLSRFEKIHIALARMGNGSLDSYINQKRDRN